MSEGCGEGGSWGYPGWAELTLTTGPCGSNPRNQPTRRRAWNSCRASNPSWVSGISEGRDRGAVSRL